MFEVEHIVPAGEDALPNLALACRSCNGHKLSATHAKDPLTDQTVPLFNPRIQTWNDHFSLAVTDDGAVIEGRTPVGRATAKRLGLNLPRAKLARLIWIYAIRSYEEDRRS